VGEFARVSDGARIERVVGLIGATLSGQIGLFTEDADFSRKWTAEIRCLLDNFGDEMHAPTFGELNVYEATMHFNGQSTTDRVDPLP
jgi:hypothetical protein